MKYLRLTNKTKADPPKNPNNGYPYVFFNSNIDVVWIFLGLKWILANGTWMMQKSWDETGIWNYYRNIITGYEL